VGADGRKTVLRLGLRGPRRERFAQLLDRLAVGARVKPSKSDRLAEPIPAGGRLR
jgi:hypothetical protein